MQVIVQGKQVDVGAALKTHAEDKLQELNAKYFNRAIDAQVTFSREGHGFFKVHISLKIGRNMTVQSEAVENDAYLAFDVASVKLAKQMRRHKRRLRDHREHGDADDVTTARGFIYADASFDQSDLDDAASDATAEPAIVAELTTPILTLSVSEAVMRLDLSGQPALLFRNSKDNAINMIYRRTDGNIGWVDANDTSVRAQAGSNVRPLNKAAG